MSPTASATGLESSPTGYRTFSPKLAPGLTALGGILTIAGGLGTWIRATEVATEGALPEEVAAVSGHSEAAGWALAALGLAAVAGSLAWGVPRLLPKAAPILASAALAGFVAWRLSVLDDRAAAMAEEAQASVPEFLSFHAGFGWGAWLLLVAAILLALGVVVGTLREWDLRSEAAR